MNYVFDRRAGYKKIHWQTGEIKLLNSVWGSGKIIPFKIRIWIDLRCKLLLFGQILTSKNVLDHAG